MTAVLRIPAFRRLLVAYGLNELTWSFGTVALAVLVYHRTGSAVASTAFFLCSQFIPGLVTPLLVARVDQRTPRRVLPTLYVVEGLLYAVLAWLTGRFSLAAVLAVVLVDGSLATVARTLARSASVEVLRPVDRLRDGNAIINIAFSGCFIAGPAIAGVVVALGGTASALFINCGLFVAIAFALVTASGLPSRALNPDPVKRRVRTALDHVRGDRPLRTVFIFQIAGMIVFSISVPVEVVLAEHTLHAGPGGYAAMLSAWGGGAVLGSALFARWRRAPGRVIMVAGSVSLGVGFILMASAPSIVLAVVGAALGGVWNGSGMMAAKTMQQEYTTQRWMAMVTGLSEGLYQTGLGLGIVVGGSLTALTSPRATLAVGGVASLIYAAVLWPVLSPTRLPKPPPPDGARADEPAPETMIPIRAESRETLA